MLRVLAFTSPLSSGYDFTECQESFYQEELARHAELSGQNNQAATYNHQPLSSQPVSINPKSV